MLCPEGDHCVAPIESLNFIYKLPALRNARKILDVQEYEYLYKKVF